MNKSIPDPTTVQTVVGAVRPQEKPIDKTLGQKGLTDYVGALVKGAFWKGIGTIVRCHPVEAGAGEPRTHTQDVDVLWENGVTEKLTLFFGRSEGGEFRGALTKQMPVRGGQSLSLGLFSDSMAHFLPPDVIGRLQAALDAREKLGRAWGVGARGALDFREYVQTQKLFSGLGFRAGSQGTGGEETGDENFRILVKTVCGGAPSRAFLHALGRGFFGAAASLEEPDEALSFSRESEWRRRYGLRDGGGQSAAMDAHHGSYDDLIPDSAWNAEIRNLLSDASRDWRHDDYEERVIEPLPSKMRAFLPEINREGKPRRLVYHYTHVQDFSRGGEYPASLLDEVDEAMASRRIPSIEQARRMASALALFGTMAQAVGLELPASRRHSMTKDRFDAFHRGLRYTWQTLSQWERPPSLFDLNAIDADEGRKSLFQVAMDHGWHVKADIQSGDGVTFSARQMGSDARTATDCAELIRMGVEPVQDKFQVVVAHGLRSGGKDRYTAFEKGAPFDTEAGLIEAVHAAIARQLFIPLSTRLDLSDSVIRSAMHQRFEWAAQEEIALRSSPRWAQGSAHEYPTIGVVPHADIPGLAVFKTLYATIAERLRDSEFDRRCGDTPGASVWPRQFGEPPTKAWLKEAQKRGFDPAFRALVNERLNAAAQALCLHKAPQAPKGRRASTCHAPS